jgi:ketosteroid isomerase-like protein
MSERSEHGQEITEAADRLGAAFATRDLAAALDCFVTDDDIGYVGSEPGECATGRAAVSALLAQVFARPEAYGWRTTTSTVRRYADCAYLMAEADGRVDTDAGDRIPFAYRLSGLLEPVAGRWRWRYCHGCEPAG